MVFGSFIADGLGGRLFHSSSAKASSRLMVKDCRTFSTVQYRPCGWILDGKERSTLKNFEASWSTPYQEKQQSNGRSA